MRGMKLRSSGMGSSCHWTESLLFDNCCQDFPVEMFVELMAEECKDRHSDEEICRRAMQHLPPDLAQPFKERLDDCGLEVSDKLTWDEMRSDLVHTFSNKNFSNDNYKLELLQSLTKGRREKATTFLARVKFVATVIEAGKWEAAHAPPSISWVRILFLNGLTANECYSLLSQYGLNPDEMASYLQCNVKVEDEDFGEVRVKREDLNHSAAGATDPHSIIDNEDLLYPIIGDDFLAGGGVVDDDNGEEEEAVVNNDDDDDEDYDDDEEEKPLRKKRKKRKKPSSKKSSAGAAPAAAVATATFDCQLCNKSFRGSVTLANHVTNVHHNATPPVDADVKMNILKELKEEPRDTSIEDGQVFPCKICSVVLKTQNNLDKHLKSVHSNTICAICSQEFGSKDEWTDHCNSVHGGSRVKCKICDMHFKTQSTLDKHCTDKHEGRKFKCHICQKEILAQRAFDKHMKLLHSDPTKAIPKHMLKAQTNYHKPLSEEEFLAGNYPYKGLYMQVIKSKTQSGKKTYVCALCEAKIEGHKEFFNGHVKGVHNGHIARCDVCDFTSQVWLRVVSHRLKKHNLTTDGFKVINCTKEGCQFKTVQEVELEKHTEAVHDKIKFQCDHCQKWLSTKGALKLHVENVHLGWKRFACEICGLSFKSERYQQIHMDRKHLNIIPERKMCEECGSTFIDKAALNRHISVHHSGAPSQKCMHCDKSFYHRAGLLSHIRTVHQMDKSFYCQKCSRAFSSGFKLRMHIATFHLNMKPFRCTVCNSSFPKSSNLCYHIGTSHMGLSLAEARKSCKLAKAHKAYEYTKPDESLFEAYKPFDLKEQNQMQQHHQQQQQAQPQPQQQPQQQQQQLHHQQHQIQHVQQVTTASGEQIQFEIKTS